MQAIIIPAAIACLWLGAFLWRENLRNFAGRAARAVGLLYRGLAIRALVVWESCRWRNGAVALGNALGLMFKDGKETLQVDSTVSVPVSSKYLVWMRGTLYNTASIANGANYPLGISPDAPYQAGDEMTVYRFGAMPYIMLGFSAGAITIDHLVYSAASGQIGDLTLAGNGSYWVIGRAAATVTAANSEISFVPCVPYEITVSGGGGNYAFAGAGV